AAEGRRLASQGVLVLYDRYPLPTARLGGRTVDGPRIRQLPAAERSGLLQRLARREEAMYRGIALPDALLVLRIAADVALARKASRDPAGAARKADALDAMDREATRVIDVDAGQPLDEVVRDVKRNIWELL
ncbi:MAG TPA: hypothetical protein VHK28_07345, partial [Candidatus Limnocylindria bacterium]|nr:hypothetical protein [Candidatus Limnocylindria bacterium]